jgi:hypothetical protein
LGAGCASLLALELRSKLDATVRAIAFAPPCCLSPTTKTNNNNSDDDGDVARATVTAFALADDCVPRFSAPRTLRWLDALTLVAADEFFDDDRADEKRQQRSESVTQIVARRLLRVWAIDDDRPLDSSLENRVLQQVTMLVNPVDNSNNNNNIA